VRYVLATLLLVASSAAHAESMLYSGVDIPKGWADGFTFSVRSRTDCQRLMAQIPNDATDKRKLKCIARVDPNAAKPAPTS
jgi:hypothetical protein